jgi:hypothetical protein
MQPPRNRRAAKSAEENAEKKLRVAGCKLKQEAIAHFVSSELVSAARVRQ